MEIRNAPRCDDMERLAERLGVPPMAEDEYATLVFNVDLQNNGPRYDILRLINAVLDRLDEA